MSRPEVSRAASCSGVPRTVYSPRRPDVLGGENRQLPTGGFHLVRGTGDSTELSNSASVGPCSRMRPLVQDQDLLEEGRPRR